MIEKGTTFQGTKKTEALIRKGAKRVIEDSAAPTGEVSQALHVLTELEKRRERKTAEKLGEASQKLAERTRELEQARPQLAKLARVEREIDELRTKLAEVSNERDRYRKCVEELLEKDNLQNLDLSALVAIAEEQTAKAEPNKT